MSYDSGDTPSVDRGDSVSLFGLIRSDLVAKAEWIYERSNFSAIVKVLLTDGTAAMLWYRLMQWSRKWYLIPLELFCNKMNSAFCSCVIGRGAEFGPGFVIVHSNGIVINGTVRGGRGIILEHQVTIGAEKRQSPVLGDNVFVGAGAKILGSITIGSDVRIGANAVVLNDLPDHATAVGIPAKVVRIRASQDLAQTEVSP